MWIDTHCHIHGEENPLELARNAFVASVDSLICVGTDVTTSHAALGVANTIESEIRGGANDLPRAYSTIGLHPHDASNQGMAGIDGIERLLKLYGSDKSNRLVGIGECGLDYFYLHSEKSDQRKVFSRQIELAKAYDLTLIIHTRDSWDDTFSILDECGVPDRMVFHCFTGDREIAFKAIEIGAFLSFSGMVTFKNAEPIREAAKSVPLDRILVETDSPYLAPIPHRGKPNVPEYVSIVGEFMADLRKISVEEFSRSVKAAASECFLI